MTKGPRLPFSIGSQLAAALAAPAALRPVFSTCCDAPLATFAADSTSFVLQTSSCSLRKCGR